VTVIDDWQGRGLGTALLELLAERALAEGVTWFTAWLLAENRDILDVLEAIAPLSVVDRESGTIEIEADLRQAARARASSSSRKPSASACGSGTSPASVRKQTVTEPA